jgi:hypothetical protein
MKKFSEIAYYNNDDDDTDNPSSSATTEHPEWDGNIADVEFEDEN